MVHRQLLRSLHAFLLEVIDSLMSRLPGGKSAWIYFCMGGLPLAKGVTHVSATFVHCALAIWTTQGLCFPKEGRMKERDWRCGPKVVTRWQNACFHWVIQNNQLTPGKLIWLYLQHWAFPPSKMYASLSLWQAAVEAALDGWKMTLWFWNADSVGQDLLSPLVWP